MASASQTASPLSKNGLDSPAGREPDAIRVRGAREHNLRDIDVTIPRDALVVITGLSGSGKSSLAFDTLYAEGQRRYVESLSAYARQFLDQMTKPDVDDIEGLSPAISIEQKVATKNPRSTVGTTTEIFDYLRLLFARAGTPHCPKCGLPISSQSIGQMTDRVLMLPEGARALILAPVVRGRKGAYKKELDGFRRKGFVKVRVDGTMLDLSDEIALARTKRHDIEVVVDRLLVQEKARARIADSVDTALRLTDGLVGVINDETGEEWLLSRANACVDCGTSFPEIAPRMFSFNSPAGACEACNGLGEIGELDPELAIPDASLSLSQGAIEPWRGRRNRKYYEALTDALALHLDLDLDAPWSQLPAKARKAILYGTSEGEIQFQFRRGRRVQKIRLRWDGVAGELARRAAEEEATELDRYRRPVPCQTCDGTRLRGEAHHVKIAGRTIAEVSALPIAALADWVDDLQLEATQRVIADRILLEIRERLQFLVDVGLRYLSLDRPSRTLSGGESQRIRLATQIGSRLLGVLYILDEPSIGLHPRDNQKLLESLLQLRDMGNTVLVVEHDEATIVSADHVIDMGPGAGIHGGEVVAEGDRDALLANPNSLTGAYLSGRRRIRVPEERRKPAAKKMLRLRKCRQHNLKSVDLDLPLGLFTVVTGVSGSGKSTLVNDTLHRALASRLHGAKQVPGAFSEIAGLDQIDKVIDVSQAPIGRTPRSNPATYSGAFDGIRQLFSQVPEARMRGYGPGRFSFNVKGGRCESCKGDGLLRVEMHFLPDLFVTCEVCKGRRYNRETLEIAYKGHSIADMLEMSVEEALVVMENVGAVRRPLQALHDVGLDYIHVGQPATTLSGGEAQRIKLAKELGKRSTGRTLYLLDEPTTGLHFADVDQLLGVLTRLVELGNTVVVIEHHLGVVKSADWVIDLGPDGGDAGGEIVGAGTPEAVARLDTHTGRALAEALRT